MTDRKESKKVWYEEHKEKVKVAAKAWKKAHREKVREHNRAYRKRYPEKADRADRANRLKSYGWTLALYSEQVLKQKGLCVICGREPERGLDADHDHSTNTPRELLCNSCNIMIGYAKESPNTLDKAAAYLRKWGKI